MRRSLVAAAVAGATATVLVVALAAAAGCGRAPSGEPTTSGRAISTGTVERTIDFDGGRRSYLVHVPQRMPGRSGLPVVVGLHGGGGNGAQFERQSGLSAVADRAGFIAVYPDGSGRTQLLTWNAGNCCGYARDRAVDDVGFLAEVLDQVAATYRTDPARVYVTGISNGAMMAYRLACTLTDRLAAIAPVAGAINVTDCRPSRPLPVLVIHGMADELVPYDGGPPQRGIPGAGSWQNSSVPQAVSLWTDRNRCPATPTETRDQGVLRTTYAPCADGTEVRVCAIEDGGHAWPGGRKGREAADDPPPRPDASSEIWEFFARFPAR